MARITYNGPTSDEIVDTSNIASIVATFVDPVPGYWNRGARGASIIYQEATAASRLNILPHGDNKFYFQHLRRKDDAGRWRGELLSLRDKMALDIIIVANCDWRASEGLFLDGRLSSLVVQDFVRSGEPSNVIEWVRPNQLPSTGNW